MISPISLFACFAGAIETYDYTLAAGSLTVNLRPAVEVFAYCIVGNHYHLCLRTPEGNLPG